MRNVPPVFFVSSPVMSRLRPQLHAARAHRVVGEEIARLRDLEAEEHRDRALRPHRSVLHERREHARHLAQVADARRVVVRAGLLHVRAQRRSARRRVAAVHFGDERELVGRIHLRLRHARGRMHRTLRERRAQAVDRVVRDAACPSSSSPCRTRSSRTGSSACASRAACTPGMLYASTPIAPRFCTASLNTRPTLPSASTILPATGRLVVVGRRSLPDVDELRDDAGVGRRERIDRQHVAVRREAAAPARDSPTIVTLASTGSHAGWRIGRCSMRYVSTSPGLAVDSST